MTNIISIYLKTFLSVIVMIRGYHIYAIFSYNKNFSSKKHLDNPYHNPDRLIIDLSGFIKMHKRVFNLTLYL